MIGNLVTFFGAGPARLQALLIGALAMAVMCLALTVWALWERSGRYQAERDREVFKMQSEVYSDGLNRCNAGVDQVKRVGDAAVEGTDQLLAAARKINAAAAGALQKLDEKMKAPTPTRPDGKPADCNDARAEIQGRK